MVGGVVLLALGVYFKEELYEKWMRSGGLEDVTYEGIQSTLEDQGACYLCGSSDYSLVDYYRKFDTIGVISLNDWYVLDFRLKCQDENGNEVNGEEGTSSSFGNTGEVIYSTESNFQGTMASITVTLPDGYKLKPEMIQEHLCQKCLDKLLSVMETYGPEGEEPKPRDLCLVDFQTLELYSLQEHYASYYIRDYYVRLDQTEDGMEIEAVYAPERD